ncbi:hypothetical protein [Roseobacter sp.]|uniref:hypothetical protein n=1 Tax=Roseobacter sp. TaxID=1907202 RepID=UPI00385B28F7
MRQGVVAIDDVPIRHVVAGELPWSISIGRAKGQAPYGVVGFERSLLDASAPTARVRREMTGGRMAGPNGSRWAVSCKGYVAWLAYRGAGHPCADFDLLY